MKKLIKTSDIKKMVKAYGLSGEEVFWLEDISHDINSEMNLPRYDTMLSFLCSPNCFSLNPPRYDALASILHYFGSKTLQVTGLKFHETCEELGRMLNATTAGIERIFRGMSFTNKRWSNLVYVADKCGLNSMELTFPKGKNK